MLGRAKYTRRMNGAPPPFMRPSSGGSLPAMATPDSDGLPQMMRQEPLVGGRVPSAASESKFSVQSRASSKLSDIIPPPQHKLRYETHVPRCEDNLIIL